MSAGAKLAVPAEHEERAILPVQGHVTVNGRAAELAQLLVLKPRAETVIEAVAPSRVLLLGGERLDGPRFMWWNFVSSSKDRIEQAKADWRAGRFATVPGETEFIPLPE
jgi:redox-sensitive bicupin YhaK (pirin superfamily)